ncbi:hypothetical protein PVAG01_01166 [Phlyctema vagabunda]|uniref:Uncharacterized protein n=1 Tax=Phlyctema vagabunda TaxID=108571 RepID=A0ABR4PWS5_9HELO
MYASSTFLFAAVMALARVASATPPACLLAAMGAQSNPADLDSICGSLQNAVAGNITEACSGDNEAAAIKIYSSSCLAAGVTVSINTASSSASRTGSASATTTGTGILRATGSASATGTGSGSSGSSGSGSQTSGSDATATGSTSSASSTANESTGAGASTSPQSALLMGTVVLGFGVASYLL